MHKKLNIGLIRIDGGTQARESINQEAVQEYAEAIAQGATFPPVTIFFDGAEPWLADGFHRYHAHRHAGRHRAPTMTSNNPDRIELRVDVSVLDGYCNATGRSRADVVRCILSDWSLARIHEAKVICRVAGVNPFDAEPGRK